MKATPSAILAAILLVPIVVSAETTYPLESWREAPNPYASPHAEVGGEISTFAGPYPRSLNYFLDTSVHSAEILGLLYDSLLSMNPATLDYEPGLAERWTVSDDKRVITIHLDPAATWSDGTPITADDIVWTWQAILDPKNLTGPHKVDLERYEAPEVLDERTVRFTAREAHWKNLMSIAGVNPLPKHVLATQDFNKINL